MSVLISDIRVELLTIIAFLLFYLSIAIIGFFLNILKLPFSPIGYTFIIATLIPLMNYLGRFGVRVDYMVDFYEKNAEKIKEKVFD